MSGDAALPDLRPSRIEVVDPSTLFSAAELAQVVEITAAMGLDFGEVDILRDPISKSMHVIDVNKTPANSLQNWRTALRIIRLAAHAFEEQFLAPAAGQGIVSNFSPVASRRP